MEPNCHFQLECYVAHATNEPARTCDGDVEASWISDKPYVTLKVVTNGGENDDVGLLPLIRIY